MMPYRRCVRREAPPNVFFLAVHVVVNNYEKGKISRVFSHRIHYSTTGDIVEVGALVQALNTVDTFHDIDVQLVRS